MGHRRCCRCPALGLAHRCGSRQSGLRWPVPTCHLPPYCPMLPACVGDFRSAAGSEKESQARIKRYMTIMDSMTGAGWSVGLVLWSVGLLLWSVLLSTSVVRSSRSHAATPAYVLITTATSASLPASPVNRPCSAPFPARRQGAGQQQHQAAHRADAHPALGARIRQQRAGARLRVWVGRAGGCLALVCRYACLQSQRCGASPRLGACTEFACSACCPALLSPCLALQPPPCTEHKPPIHQPHTALPCPAQLATNHFPLINRPRRTWCTCWRSTSGWPRSSPVSAAGRTHRLGCEECPTAAASHVAPLGSVCSSRPAGWPQALLPCQCRHPPPPSLQP